MRSPGAIGRYPATRMRRTRSQAFSRRLVAESALDTSQLIQPFFVIEGDGTQPVESMPGVERLGLQALLQHAQRVMELGIPAIVLFPCLLYTSPSPRDLSTSRMPSSA